MLITFIENAFKYGTDYKGKTQITIMIKVEKESLSLNVKNIIGLHKKDKDNSGIGLKNIKNQLSHLYKENYLLRINTDQGFYIVDLKIKL